MKYSELRKLLSEKREGLLVEYKSQISDPFKFARSVGAMANSLGGRIYIGVDEDDKGKPIVLGVKYAVKDMNAGVREKTWDELTPTFSSYDITYGAFLGEVRKLGVPFTEFYEEQFNKYLRQALRNTCKRLDKLIAYLDGIQSKFGAFQRSD